MARRSPVSTVVKLAALAALVYGARHVDVRGLAASLTPSSGTAVRPASGPCVDLNAADRGQLERIAHIDAARSREVIEQRLVEPFHALGDLDRISGMGPGWIRDVERQGLACVR